MAKSFADEIRGRLPRILTDLVTILALIIVLYLILPISYVTSYVIPGLGVVSGIIVGLGGLIIAIVLEVRMYRDLMGLVDAFAAYAVARREQYTAAKRKEATSSLAELGRVVSLLILLALISPVLVIIPGIGVLVVALPIAAVLIVLLYGWRSWETIRDELERFFAAFAESIAKHFEK